MTDVYAAGLTDGDYVVVDKDTICQRTAAPMCRTHATSPVHSTTRMFCLLRRAADGKRSPRFGGRAKALRSTLLQLLWES
jgi:hypothetical protein